MEGKNLGVNTLFVSSNSKVPYNKLRNFLLDDSLSISKIYFGAGRQDFLGFDSDESFVKFKDFVRESNVSVTIETTLENFNNLKNYVDFCEVVLSIRNKNISIFSDIKLKIDDYQTARVFDNSICYDTDLSTVNEERYSCDKVLLNLEA